MTILGKPSRTTALGRSARITTAVAALAGGGATLAFGGGAATAITPGVVTLAQTASQGQIGKSDTITATVTVGGNPAAANTPVQFTPHGGLISDHLYTALASTHGGTGGYWLAAANGVVRNFGDAPMVAGVPGSGLDPVVAIASNSGNGLYILQADGTITPQNGATSVGNAPNEAATVVDLAVDPAGGVWVLWDDGTVSGLGGATSGSVTSVAGTPVAIVADPVVAGGYWVVTTNGEVRAGGGAPALSSFTEPASDDMVGAAANAAGTGLWGITQEGAIEAVGTGTASSSLTVDNAPIATLTTSTSGAPLAVGEDGQVYAPTAADFKSDAWTAMTNSSGVATLAVTGSFPGQTTVLATAAGGTSDVLQTWWAEPPGYWEAAADGGIFNYGDAHFFGSAGNIKLNKPIVGFAPSLTGLGYWEVASDGGIFNYGLAGFYKSAGNLKLNKPIVGMAASPDDGGYWEVASDGGIFNYGDTDFFGSTGAMHLNQPIVAMAATPDGGGYWLVAADGGVFNYGDAGYFGSTGNIKLNAPIVGIVPTPTGGGYWLIASDGGVFKFGDAGFYGSAGNIKLNKPVVAAAATPFDGTGYWLFASDGGVFNYGDAVFAGSAGNIKLNQPIVAAGAEPGLLTELGLLARSTTTTSSYRVPVKFSPEYRYTQWELQHKNG